MEHLDLESLAVADNPAAGRYEARVGSEVVGVAAYRLTDETITFTHTEVPEALEGRGIAGRLVGVALDDARARGLAVVPACPYVRDYVRRHPEYRDLVSEP